MITKNSRKLWRKRNRSLTRSLGAAGAVLMATQATSLMATHPELATPRGLDVLPEASVCGVGPYSQEHKAGIYNQLCSNGSEAEKCLAIIKDVFWNIKDQNLKPGESELTAGPITVQVRQELALKTEYCAEYFNKAVASSLPPN